MLSIPSNTNMPEVSVQARGGVSTPQWRQRGSYKERGCEGVRQGVKPVMHRPNLRTRRISILTVLFPDALRQHCAKAIALSITAGGV